MRAVVQRVAEAHVKVGDETVGRIGSGLCVFYKRLDAGTFRIFEDYQGKMNRAVSDSGGEVLVISQFTLYGDCRKGNRPSFTDAAPAAMAERLYQRFAERLRAAGLRVATGRFQAHMRVALVNDGPVTLVLEN